MTSRVMTNPIRPVRGIWNARPVTRHARPVKSDPSMAIAFTNQVTDPEQTVKALPDHGQTCQYYEQYAEPGDFKLARALQSIAYHMRR